ncbi:MAG: DUF559 domain-containing protein [Fibrobacterota bacterium]
MPSNRPLEMARKLRVKQTPAEVALWEVLRNRKLDGKKFQRQHRIQYKTQTGTRLAIADFYCWEHMLVVELDGSIHDLQKEKDSERDFWLLQNGYRTIRFSNDDVLNSLDSVIASLRAVFSS